MDAIDWEIRKQKKDIKDLSKKVEYSREKGEGGWIYLDGMVLQKKRYIDQLKRLKQEAQESKKQESQST